MFKIILLHVHLLLGGDREMDDCTAAVPRQRPANKMEFLRGPLSNN
jgi:hypothetical protein